MRCLRCLNARSRQREDALASCGMQRLEACMQSPASSSGSGLASACFIAVSRRCGDGEKIDGRDMEVGECFGKPAGAVLSCGIFVRFPKRRFTALDL
jgi:hypothetical protein